MNLPCQRPYKKRGLLDPKSKEKLCKRLDHYLTKKGFKKSNTRNIILEHIFSMPSHFTLQELELKTKTHHPHIGVATLYRTINLFVKAKILNEIILNTRDMKFYELNIKSHHDHIFCLDCKRMFEFSNEKIEMIQNEISKSMGFVPQSHRHILFANCYYKKN